MASSQNPFSHPALNTTALGAPSFTRRGPGYRCRGDSWGGSPSSLTSYNFTAEKRDLQARGKDPYDREPSDGSDLSPERLPGGGRMASHHSHHHHQKR
jgi:hypothetical protein